MLFSITGVVGIGGIAVALDHYITTHIQRKGGEERLVFRLEAPYGSVELRPGVVSGDVATVEMLADDANAHNISTSYSVRNGSIGMLRVGVGTDEGMRSSPPLAMWYAKSGFVTASAPVPESDQGSLMLHSPVHFTMPPIEPNFGYYYPPRVTRISTDAGTSVIPASSAGTRIHLTKDLPTDLVANLGFGESTLDLTGLQLTNAMIETGASKAYIFCNQTNSQNLRNCSVRAGIGQCIFTGISNLNADRFAFRGALGSYHLGFDGHLTHNLDVVVEIGLGMCTLSIPPTTARVQVFFEDGLLSSFSFPGLAVRRDGYASSPGFDKSTSPILTLHLSSGAGKISVNYH